MKKLLLPLSIGSNIILAVTACVLFNRLALSEQSRHQRELEANYEALARCLCVPSEAIYLSQDTFLQICELRKRDFPAEFTPYQAVVRPLSASIHKTASPGDIWNGSFEVFWLNEADRALVKLASHLEAKDALATYIQDHADDQETSLVPSVERLLESNNRWHRIKAARALLALGRRDQKVMDVLKAFLAEEKILVKTDQGEVLQDSSEKEKAARLDSQYQLGLKRELVKKPASE